jgi:hypothetical protein
MKKTLVSLILGSAALAVLATGPVWASVPKVVQMILVEHHRQDQQVCPFGDQRAAFYGVGPIPHTVFDGENERIGSTSCASIAVEFRQMLLDRLAETGSSSPVAIEGSHTIMGGTLQAAAILDLVDPVALEDLHALLIVIEDGIVVGPTTFDFVTRDGIEQEVTLSGPNDAVVVEHEFTLDPTWVTDNLRVVAAVQTFSGDTQIYQSALLPLATASVKEEIGPPIALRFSVGPNPVNLAGGPRSSAVTFSIDLPASQAGAPVVLDLLDSTGRVIRHLHNDRGAPGPLRIAWDGRSAAGRPVPSGAYWARLTTAAGPQSERFVVLR